MYIICSFNNSQIFPSIGSNRQKYYECQDFHFLFAHLRLQKFGRLDQISGQFLLYQIFVWYNDGHIENRTKFFNPGKVNQNHNV